jgi:amidase
LALSGARSDKTNDREARMRDYAGYDGLGLAALVRSRAVSPTEILAAALERAEAVNPKLNAIVHLDEAAARASAGAVNPEAPFAGVPFLIKDLYYPVAGMPMTNGSAFVGRQVSADDDPYVTRCREGGLVIFGKSNTPEFGIPGTTESAFLGACRNPWNTAHSSGGSSGGAASAVAAGILPMAHASDGQGSIRIPAAQCGLFGMKPTRGRNPRTPNAASVFDFATCHVVSWSVRDSAAMLDLTGTPDPYAPEAWPQKSRPYLEDAAQDPKPLRIAFHGAPPSGVDLHADVAATLAETAKRLEALGHIVFEAPITLDWRGYYAAQSILTGADQAGIAARLIAAKGREPEPGELDRNTADIWRAVSRIDAARIIDAWHKTRDFCRQIIAHWERWDVFLCPVAITPPPPIGYIDTVSLDAKEIGKRQSRIFGFTPWANFTGQPSTSIPLGMSQDGLPIGMMLTGAYGDEATLFQLSGQLERAHPWFGRRPKL